MIFVDKKDTETRQSRRSRLDRLDRAHEACSVSNPGYRWSRLTVRAEARRAFLGSPGLDLLCLVGFSSRFVGLNLLHLVSPFGDSPPAYGACSPLPFSPGFTGLNPVPL